LADYYAILTNAGAAALAAKTTSSPVLLATMVLGDGNGASYTPDPAQTALVHQLASVAIESVEVDASHSNWVNIRAIVPLDIGGFTVREVGLKLDTGVLFAVVKYPPTLKPAPGDGQEVEMLIAVTLVISSTSDIEVVSSGTLYASQNYVQSSRDFYAVLSDAVASPPGSPANSDAYLIPTGATGAWAGLDGKIAVWFATDWLYLTPRVGAHVDTGASLLRRTSLAWVPLVASDTSVGLVELATASEAATGTDTQRALTPAALLGRTATASRIGLVELATDAETITGADAARAVTPASLNARTATDARAGLVELATLTEVKTGTDSSRAVTPASLAAIRDQIDSNAFFLGMF
jgi:hypothetical protein